jgi:hypothetical protein
MSAVERMGVACERCDDAEIARLATAWAEAECAERDYHARYYDSATRTYLCRDESEWSALVHASYEARKALVRAALGRELFAAIDAEAAQ